MKTKKILVTALLILAFFTTENALFGQWVKRYTGVYTPGNDIGNAIAIDNSGNCYVTGQSDNINFNGTSISTVKYNSSGVQQWASRYEGIVGGNDAGNSIAVYTDASQNTYIYVTGKTHTTDQGDNYVTIKYNPDGSQAWARTYNGTDNGDDIANRIDVDQNDGSIYITGQSKGTNGYFNYITRKYDPSGSTIWTSTYDGDGTGDNIAKSLKVAGGNVYVTGSSVGYRTGQDIITIAYNGNIGDSIWTRRYNGPSNVDDWANDIAVDAQHLCVFVSGTSEDGSAVGKRLTIIKYSNGTQQWVADDHLGEGMAIALYRKGCGLYTPCFIIDVFVTGYGMSLGFEQGLTIKYNENSNILTGIIYTLVTGTTRFVGLGIDPLENVYVSGFRQPGFNPLYNYLTEKYNSSLNSLIWSRIYDNTSSSKASGIKVDGNENSYITGYSDTNTTSRDYLTIKYNPSGNFNRLILPNSENSQPDIPENFILRQNCPNPFNPSTEIKYDLPKDEYVTLKVFNLLGQEVSTLIYSEFKTAGRYSVKFDASNLSSGMYIYKIWAGSFIETKKMILIK